jgi:hypothetical protein
MVLVRIPAVVLQDCCQLDQAFGSCRENSTTAESSKAKASFVGATSVRGKVGQIDIGQHKETEES